MSELRKAQTVAAHIHAAVEMPETPTEAAELVTADRLAIVEWLRACATGPSLRASHLRAAADELEAAIRSAAGEGD